MSTEIEKAGAPPDDVSLTSIPGAESQKFKEFIVYKTGLSNFKLASAGSETPVFFVNTSLYSPNKADIVLHASDSHGKILGAVDLKKFAGHYEVALGDPSKDKAAFWEPLEVVQYWASRHRFEFDFGNDGGVKSFLWRHPGERLSDHPGDMELVKEETPDHVLAQFVKAGTHSWKSRGNLLIREGYGEMWELMVVLTAMALVVVKSRRQ